MLRLKNPNPSRLPSEYQEVEYLESTGTQYIDTGIMPNHDTSVEMDAQLTNTSSASNIYCFFGARNLSTTRYFGVWDVSQNNYYMGWLYNNQALLWDNITQTTLGNRHIISTNKNVATLDGVSKTSTYTSFSVGYSMYLFASNDNGTASFKAPMKLYSFKIYDNGTLIRNFVSCYRKSDNVAGLYDLINNVFYINAGTGTFLVGTEVNKRDVNYTPKIGGKIVIREYVGNKLVYGEEPSNYEQLVNYTMLYDGSLGDPELNECKEASGGWELIFRYSGLTNNATPSSNCLKLGMTGDTSFGGFYAKNAIDTTQYTKVLSIFGYSFASADTWNSAYISFIDSYAGSGIIHAFSITNVKETVTKKSHIASLNASYPFLRYGLNSKTNTNSLTVYFSVVLKQDNWQELCTIAGLTSSDYTDEATLCANSTAIETILSNQNAVEFMIKQCTGSFMASAVASETFLTALNNSDYNTTIQANEHWNKFLSMVA